MTEWVEGVRGSNYGVVNKDLKDYTHSCIS